MNGKKIPWHRHMFADQISDHMSFIIVALPQNCLPRLCMLASDTPPTPTVESFEIRNIWRGTKKKSGFFAFSSFKSTFHFPQIMLVALILKFTGPIKNTALGGTQ